MPAVNSTTMVDPVKQPTVEASPMNIATISAGFEKGDFLVREEQGNRVYFDFFEEVRLFIFLPSLPPRKFIRNSAPRARRWPMSNLCISLILLLCCYCSCHFKHILPYMYLRHSTTSPTRVILECLAKMKSTGST
jgi:hypothetical protein